MEQEHERQLIEELDQIAEEEERKRTKAAADQRLEYEKIKLENIRRDAEEKRIQRIQEEQLLARKRYGAQSFYLLFYLQNFVI